MSVKLLTFALEVVVKGQNNTHLSSVADRLRLTIASRIMAVCSLIIYILPSLSQEQLHYDLQSAIRQAQDSSIQAFIATHDYETARYAYDYYISSTRPQVSLNITPSYYKQNTNADYNYALPSSLNMAGLSADVSFQKQISHWGGMVYAQTKTVWTELLGDMADDYGASRYFGVQPIRVGYKQDLLGWNAYKWEHKIESHHNELACKQLDYRMRQIAEQTAGYYFDYVSARLYRDIYEQNYLTADTLYKIGKEKFKLTTVTKDELMSLEISRTNAENQLKLAETQLENARLSLLSLLHVEDTGQALTLEDATVPTTFTIDEKDALAKAAQNDPLAMQLDEEVLTAERDLDEARHRRGLQVGMDVSVGMQNINRTYGQALSPRHYAQAEMTFSVPLYDSHLARNRVKKTEAAVKAARYAHEEQQRQTADEVRSVINLLRVQQGNIPNAQHNVQLADAAFELVSKRYADGLSDMNTYQLMLSRKDEAHQIYISLLNNFWTNYYKLTRLTMSDFITR